MAEMKTKDGRYRNFATVFYPESAVDGWQSALRDLCVPGFISPLHDLDVNPGGENKKAHYHVVLMFDGKKSIEQVRSLVEPLGAVGCEPINTIRGYARYLCHLDNPEKHQYDVESVVSFGGADYTAIIGLPTDKYKALREMMAFCRDNDIDSFAELADIAADSNMEWFRILADCGAVFMKEYLKSRSWGRSRHDA